MTSRSLVAAALFAACAVPTAADAFEVKHAPRGELVRWRRSSVSWTIDRSMQDVPGGAEAVTAAVDAWTQRAGAPSLSIDSTAATLRPGVDGINGVFYAPEGYEPAGAALAVTILAFDERTGAVVDADIVLNGKYRFGEGPSAYDVNRVLAHEMGHALGLSDEHDRKDALMYPYQPKAHVLTTVPASDDLDGLSVLYAGGGGSGGSARTERGGACGGAVIAPAGPGSAPSGAYVGIGLSIIGLALARRGGRPRRAR